MFKYASKILVGTLAFAALAACNRENPDGNPLYNKETKEVQAQFVISVSTGQDSGTKQSANAVQQNGNFRGITDGTILLFKSFNGSDAYSCVVDPALVATKSFEFGTLYSQGQISNSGTNNRDNSSQRVLQLSLPTGVNTALIYGEAIHANTNSENGHVVRSVSDTPSDTYFALTKRIGDSADDITAYNNTEKLMVKALNLILGSSITSINSYLGYTDLPAISWKEYGSKFITDPTAMSPLGEIIGRSYNVFTSIASGENGEYRAGCSAAIRRQIQDMVTVMNNAGSATPSSKLEANAKRLLLHINDNIEIFFDKQNNWVYKAVDDIKTALIEKGIYANEAAFDSEYTGVRDLNDFPYGTFHIPVGAAQLAYDATKVGDTELDYNALSYLKPNHALLTPGAMFDPERYAYPAELLYYCNSPLMVNNNEVSVSSYPNGALPWETPTAWTTNGWSYTNGTVSSSTRGVAVKDNIHYGVALLKSTVALSGGPYLDNRSVVAGTGEPDNSFTSLNLELTGVLVGGQNCEMNWQYLRKNEGAHTGDSNTNDKSFFNWVVYDDDLIDGAVPTSTTAPAASYTMLFDNYDSSLYDPTDPSKKQSDVNVALEFKNNGEPFWGKHNLIPTNGVFYLLGKLKPANIKAGSATAITWPENYQVPPVWLKGETPSGGAKVGDSKKIERVFIQGFQTIATFTITSNSLKNAYYTMPDLRSAQMSLGLSVDLKWKSGFEYDVPLGAN